MIKTLSLDSFLPFGKYKGLQVEGMIRLDPQYMKWLVENTDLTFDEEVMERINAI